MEQLENLFDFCDSSHLGKVPVSKLILTVTNEVNTFNNNDHQQHEKEEILMTVRYLLDPSDQDVQVDKATWLAAWRKQAEIPSPKKSKVHTISDMAGGDDLGIGDECQGSLDVSKHSYCFSPGSRSSSLEDSGEVALLKEENEQLQCSLKTLKQQLQKLDDALVQEQIEKQELENLKDVEVNKLSKQIKSLLQSNEELKCSFDVSEREKLDLCKSVESQYLTEKQLNLQLTEQKRVVAALSSEIEDLHQDKESLKLNLQDLQTKLKHQENIHQEQVKEYQRTIQHYQDEKNELSSQITNTLLPSSQCWDELDCSSSSESGNLQTELAPFNFQAKSYLSDSPPSLEKSLLVEMQAVKLHAETQTQDSSKFVFLTPPKKFDKCNQAEVKVCPVETQTSQDSSKFVFLTPPKKFDKCNQAGVKVCPVETQTSQDSSKFVFLTPPKKFDKCNQAEVKQVCPVETQTSPLASSTGAIDIFNRAPDLTLRISNELNNVNQVMLQMHSVAMPCHIATQTQSEFNVTSPIPSESVDKCIQVEAKMCPVETQTSPLPSENNYKLCLSRFFTRHVFQKLPSTNDTDFSRKPPDLTLRISDEQSSVQEVSSVLPPKSRFSYLWVLSTCVIFFVLLIISTIFCTGAVLQIASDSGVLSFPYIGQTPDFVKSIMKPFVKVNIARPVGDNVPI